MTNQRSYFRVKTPIGLRYKILGSKIGQLDANSLFANSESQQLKRQMQNFRQNVNLQLRSLPSELDTVSLAVHAIQQQIDLMFNYLCNNDDKTHQVMISLSEGGIGFQSPNPINDGHFIAMHMELDELLSISCFGEVVSCEAINQSFKIGIRFFNLSEEDHQLIAKFVLQTDAEQRRLRRS